MFCVEMIMIINHSKKDDLSVWHKWFAWHPVKVSERTTIFLATVYRKADSASWDGYGDIMWRYSETSQDDLGYPEWSASIWHTPFFWLLIILMFIAPAVSFVFLCN